MFPNWILNHCDKFQKQQRAKTKSFINIWFNIQVYAWIIVYNYESVVIRCLTDPQYYIIESVNPFVNHTKIFTHLLFWSYSSLIYFFNRCFIAFCKPNNNFFWSWCICCSGDSLKWDYVGHYSGFSGANAAGQALRCLVQVQHHAMVKFRKQTWTRWSLLNHMTYCY